MELTRRDFLSLSTAVLAASAAPLVLAPASALAATERSRAKEPLPAASDPFRLDELPIQGFAGECSGARRSSLPPDHIVSRGRRGASRVHRAGEPT